MSVEECVTNPTNKGSGEYITFPFFKKFLLLCPVNNILFLHVSVSDCLPKETHQSTPQTGKYSREVFYHGATPRSKSAKRTYSQSHLAFRDFRTIHAMVLHIIQRDQCLISIAFFPSLPEPLVNSTPKVTAEELSGNDDYVELSFSARKLDDKVCGTKRRHLLRYSVTLSNPPPPISQARR